MSELFVDSELLTCPICADIFQDACDTSCGHTFCEFCLNSCLETKPDRCPVCAKDPSPIHPAFTIRSICSLASPAKGSVIDLDHGVSLDSEKELGNTSYYQNKFATAILHYNNAIDKVTNSSDPKNCVLFNNRAQCYIHLRQYKRALMDCDEAIRLSNTNVKAYMRKGLCLRQLGHFEESRLAYVKAMTLDTQHMWTSHINDGLNSLPIFKAPSTTANSNGHSSGSNSSGSSSSSGHASSNSNTSSSHRHHHRHHHSSSSSHASAPAQQQPQPQVIYQQQSGYPGNASNSRYSTYSTAAATSSRSAATPPLVQPHHHEKRRSDCKTQ
ncbi:hypothetical protein SAMD00019534_023940 [Acytostelium subglobosum LB1]|uniref:hypothetical protein n=1 Tax=Acytostelium subglobosum LB1 TaxID=1410327 RepID=UPI000644B067|nr:hypothetical protein SAMD00019534_023940 [Acytostelium subglobosum LB1]GAM19219.1 hypothetical protein SAMD00019534_023940 [Acytostelium subglobosum LB1]|eukprot:XP_012757146.1 hypothetical protein SAMD00019534_023940 [Acytostelium subglobosum LB1]